MRFLPVLLRVLMATCLILNGIGTAMASASMGASDASSSLNSPRSVDTGPHAAALPDHASDPCAGQDLGDCCSPEQCDGACTQGVQADLFQAQVPASIGFVEGPSERPAASRSDPALSQPVRPPIA
ncbi:CopL family metal-binding regulatory protein [Lysobacter olei]